MAAVAEKESPRKQEINSLWVLMRKINCRYMNRCASVTFIFILIAALNQSIGQTHVQTRTLYQVTTSTTISRNFAAPSTSGNLIVVHVDWDGQTRSVLSVTDNKGNSYAKINGPTNWDGLNYRAELWYAYNITGGGAAINITAKLTGAPTTFSQIYISEYSGIITTNPLDQNSVAIGNTAAVSSGSKTTTYTNELIYGASIGASGVLTVGAGFTSRSTANSNIIEDKNGVLAAAYDTKFTSAGGNWVAQMATFLSTTSLAVLPTQLFSFTGQCTSKNIVLDWSTATETNNDYFTIERSENSTDWHVIGTVNGGGNSSTILKYSFTADQTNQDISYFRLKQTDFDGKFKYSNIVQVGNCNKELTGLSIYPNPSNGKSLFGRTNFQINEEYSIEIYNNLGKMVAHLSSIQPEFSVNFSQILPTGVYYARFSSASFSSAKIFLVKN
jgi:hypothetical protein